METHEVGGERVQVPNIVIAAGTAALEAFLAASPADRAGQLGALQATEQARLAAIRELPLDEQLNARVTVGD